MSFQTTDSLNTTSTLLKLKELIDDDMIYASFVAGISVKTLKNGQVFLIFAAKNDLKFMRKNYAEPIKQAMQHVFGINTKFELTYTEEFQQLLDQLGSFSTRESNLNPRYLFDTYVEAKFNARVIALGKKVIAQEHTVFNPIFIYAASGLGKTHFLQGIGNAIVNKKHVCYVNPDQFMKKVTQYLIQSNQDKLAEIIDHYKEFEVLLFDDIQQYGSKPATLNVLFNILNYHIEHNNQIIIVADKDPELLGGFEERFISRFQGGITEKILTPSLEDLITVFKQKLIDSHLNPEDWDGEAIKFVVRNHSNSIRNLEGAVNKIEWNQQNSSEKIHYNYDVVAQLFSTIKRHHLNTHPDRILEIIATYYGLNKTEILGRSRRKEVVLARHISMWMIRNITNRTYKEIGVFFKGKDHSTVMNAIDKIDYQMKINETIKTALKLIKAKIMDN